LTHNHIFNGEALFWEDIVNSFVLQQR